MNFAPMGNLRFLADWTSVLTGDLAQGGKLAIEFDRQRLPQCRLNWRGAEVWDINGYARFHPSGEVFTGSLLQRIASPAGIVTTLQPIPWEVSVPFDAAQVELWFHNFYQMSSRCDAWDSRFGQNYWFDVASRGPSQPVIYRAGDRDRADRRVVMSPTPLQFLETALTLTTVRRIAAVSCERSLRAIAKQVWHYARLGIGSHPHVQ